MRERPIIFSADEVRAIVDGRKTQFRKPIRGAAVLSALEFFGDEETPPAIAYCEDGHDGPALYAYSEEYPDEGSMSLSCPYGVPGDRLWIREAWQALKGDVATSMPIWAMDVAGGPKLSLKYAADEPRDKARWRSPLYMPRWASRLTLALTEVRVEKLQDISEADARAEGVQFPDSARGGFANLWDLINGERAGCSWADNPWVWALSFKPLTASLLNNENLNTQAAGDALDFQPL